MHATFIYFLIILIFTDLQNDFEYFSQIHEINITEFMLDTAHQKKDLIHR